MKFVINTLSVGLKVGKISMQQEWYLFPNFTAIPTNKLLSSTKHTSTLIVTLNFRLYPLAVSLPEHYHPWLALLCAQFVTMH